MFLYLQTYCTMNGHRIAFFFTIACLIVFLALLIVIIYKCRRKRHKQYKPVKTEEEAGDFE